MKILFLHHLADLYGSSQSLARLTRGLIRDGHEVLVLLHEDGPLHAALVAAGARVELLPSMPVLHRNQLASPGAILRMARNVMRARRELAHIISRERPDLVHTNTAVILPIAGAVARKHGIPHIVHIRETFGDFGMLWPLYRMWIDHATDRIVCISSYLAGLFTGKQNAAKVVVIHNGIPASEFDNVDPARVATFRSQFPPGPLIGLVGRIKLVRKGQDVLIRAAGLLKNQFPDAHYVFVGAPFSGNESHLDTLRHLATELGISERVHFVGHMENPKIAMAAFDISVMASSTPEPLGNVTIESMALGKPVIGTNIGGTPEIIVDGDTGLLVPPSDPVAMAAALTRLLEHPEVARQMGERARERYRDAFEYTTFYRAITALYRSMTG